MMLQIKEGSKIEQIIKNQQIHCEECQRVDIPCHTELVLRPQHPLFAKDHLVCLSFDFAALYLLRRLRDEVERDENFASVNLQHRMKDFISEFGLDPLDTRCPVSKCLFLFVHLNV